MSIVCVFIFFLLFCNACCYNQKINEDKAISIYPKRIEPVPDSCFFEQGKGFTCTGLTYDTKNNSFWCGNYGKTYETDNNVHPTILNVTRDFSGVISEIDLSNIESIYHLEGIAYDASDDTIWISGGESIVNINKDGKILNSFVIEIESEDIRPNGIVYDNRNDTLWILCNKKYIINLDKTGNIISKISCDFFAQDQLCWVNGNLAFTVGADYNGDKNYLIIIDDKGCIKEIYKLNESYAVEGCCYIDGTLYILNDGLFHNAKNHSNYVAQYGVLLK